MKIANSEMWPKHYLLWRENSQVQIHIANKYLIIIEDNQENIYELSVDVIHIQWLVELPMIKMILTLNDQKTIRLSGKREEILFLKKQLDGQLYYINFLETHQDQQPNNNGEYKNSLDLLTHQQVYYKVIHRNQFNEIQWQIYLQHILKINRILLEMPHKNIGFAIELYKNQDQLIIKYNANLNDIILTKINHWGQYGMQYNTNYIQQLFEGINHLHQNGILVRNLNLSHIALIGNQMIIFGQEFFALIDELTPLKRCGTPGYIPPELLKNDDHSINSDLFTLGVVIHYILTGEQIYKGNPMISNCNNNQIKSEQFSPWFEQLLNSDPLQRGSIDFYLDEYFQ